MGVMPHIWGQWTPWFTIFMACAFYLMVILAARFTKYHLYKDLQDEVNRAVQQQIFNDFTIFLQ